MTPLAAAAATNTIVIDPALRVLGELSLSLNNPNSLTFLHRAVLLGTPSVELGKYARDLDAQDDQGRTPIRLAVEMGVLETCKELIDAMNCNVDIPDFAGVSPLHSACARGDEEVIDLILHKSKQINAKDKLRGESCFISAARHRQWHIVDKLLQHGGGLDFAMADAQGRTVLHWVVENMGNVQDYIACLDLLLDATNVNAQDARGWAPLHVAASRGLSDAILYLVKRGAQLNLPDAVYGNTPLHLAVARPALLQGKTTALATLIQLKADVTTKRTSDGATALDLVNKLLATRCWTDAQRLTLDVAAARLKKCAEDMQRV